MLGRKGGTVHNWMSFMDLTPLATAAVAWIVLIAAVGYAAGLAAWHGARR
jgi:hypothetical protein